jgi:CheY-like chemotaxis protein
VKSENRVERLQVLVLTTEPGLLDLIRTALREFGATHYCAGVDPARVSEILGRNHFDGIILDCDDIANAEKIIMRVRKGPSNRQSPVIAIANDLAALQATKNWGASLSIPKPVPGAGVWLELNSAFEAFQKEYRRYTRYSVRLPLLIGTEKDGYVAASVLNVSSEGMAVLVRTPPKKESVTLKFELPSIEPYPVEANGQIIWIDPKGCVGIKLVRMSLEAHRRYQEWLSVLHGQFEFRRFSAKG